MPFEYRYPRAALTVDCVVFGFDGGALKILLIRRGIDPYKDRWALPGGFVRTDETLDEASARNAPYPYFPYERQAGFARLNPSLTA